MDWRLPARPFEGRQAWDWEKAWQRVAARSPLKEPEALVLEKGLVKAMAKEQGLRKEPCLRKELYWQRELQWQQELLWE
jgi:hypothetical protein